MVVAEESLEMRKKEEEEIPIEEKRVGKILDSSSSSSILIVNQQPGIFFLHPLEHSWTFWFDNHFGKSKKITWGNSIRPVYTCSTVEDFWCLYNNIHHPSKLVVGADLYCFKHLIQPKWEDPVCANGGKWTISFSRGRADTCWLSTLLAMIGEQFDHGDEICGAVVNVRPKQEKISLWTKNALNGTAQFSIGKQWKEFLDYNDNIGFIVHEDAKKHDRCPKNRYII
ncbi:Eukaryotic translation initiation factor 4e [Thalictrum thalictroides]|uniref:eIF-4F 25 kDa subunit n=1 Tax=Thalictrum thalictroides TaxID=46969 RepID=A0A7J6VC68_THATH|nr:Eukaryotic translation initiation factor 4e [Thalictrum thalictroides]